MPGLLLMFPIAMGIALFFLGFFFWSYRNGDIDDVEYGSHRLLLDDEDDVDTRMTERKKHNG